MIPVSLAERLEARRSGPKDFAERARVWVAGRFELSRRRDNLSWSHHDVDLDRGALRMLELLKAIEGDPDHPEREYAYHVLWQLAYMGARVAYGAAVEER